MVELLTILEDELLICLPIVAYHPEDECAMKPGYISTSDDVVIVEPTGEDSPFKVLQNLKNLKS
jgi:uncharacterized protein